MRRVSAAIGTMAVLLWATTAFAQAPSFAGKWTREAPAGGAAAGGAAGGGGGRAGGGGGGGQAGRGGGGGGFQCGAACEITQTAAELKIIRPAGQDGTVPAPLVFKLDGSASSNASGREGVPPVETKAKVEGTKIVFSTSRDMGGTMVTSTQTVWLEGGKMVVETNSGREGSTPTKVTYTKG